jgi:hypothetical protein
MPRTPVVVSGEQQQRWGKFADEFRANSISDEAIDTVGAILLEGMHEMGTENGMFDCEW